MIWYPDLSPISLPFTHFTSITQYPWAFFFKDFIYFLRERKGERGREISMCGSLPPIPYGGLAHSPGMGPDWKLNQQPFGSQAGAQSTEPHQPREYRWALSFLCLDCSSPLKGTCSPSHLQAFPGYSVCNRCYSAHLIYTPNTYEPARAHSLSFFPGLFSPLVFTTIITTNFVYLLLVFTVSNT